MSETNIEPGAPPPPPLHPGRPYCTLCGNGDTPLGVTALRLAGKQSNIVFLCAYCGATLVGALVEELPAETRAEWVQSRIPALMTPPPAPKARGKGKAKR